MDSMGTFKDNITAAPAAPKGPVPWALVNGKVVTDKSPAYNIKRVRERHKMVIMLNAAGWTNNAICDALGYTPARVSIILNSAHPELIAFRKQAAQKVMDHTTDAMLRFKAEAHNCIDTLVEIRDDREAPRSERRQSAIAILDRGGYSPVRKQINLGFDIPVQELNNAVEKLESANEVFTKKDQWAVKTIAAGAGTGTTNNGA